MKPVIFIDGREGTTGLQIYDRLTPARISSFFSLTRKAQGPGGTEEMPQRRRPGLPVPARRGGPGGGGHD